MIRWLPVLAASAVLAGCARAPKPAVLQPDASLVGRRFIEWVAGVATRSARLLTTPGDVEYAIHHVDSPNETLVIGACTVGGARDVDIVAVARRESRAELTRVRSAWRASGALRTLTPIETDGIRCEHEGWREP